MSCLPNASEAGLRDHAVCVPSPPTPNVRFETPAVEVATVTVPDFTPTVPGSNFTSTVHDAPPASDETSLQSVPGPVASWNCGSSELTPEIAIGSVPSFETVTPCVAVALSSMSCLPNASDAGLRDHAVCVPRPESATVRFAASEWTVSEADLFPTVVGWKVARTVQVSAGCRTLLSTQSFASSVGCANAPGSVPPGSKDTVEIVTSTLPVLVIVEDRGVLGFGSSTSRSPNA